MQSVIVAALRIVYSKGRKEEEGNGRSPGLRGRRQSERVKSRSDLAVFVRSASKNRDPSERVGVGCRERSPGSRAARQLRERCHRSGGTVDRQS